MKGVSRRRLLRAGAALGIVGATSSRAVADEGGHDGDHSDGHDDGHSSPHLDKYVQPLPIPEERRPDGRRRGADFHDVKVKQSQHSFHPDLPETTIWGFDGQFPGPILAARRGRQLDVRFDNSQLPDEHLFEVDERIEGTTSENYVGYDGPVPEVRTVTHFHGLNVATENDGQAEMWTSPDGVTGPRHVKDVQELPNRQSRLTSTYHDHARGISRLNNYAGLVGPYYIRSHEERWLNLPDGDYDVPLVLADRSFREDGSLYYPDEFVENFAGDTATVNGAAWPYLEVEPRRYRFRFINVSNGRTYDLGLENDDGSTDVPTVHQIAPGHGFLEEVVDVGPGGDLESLVLSPFERADVVVDFSDHAGETFTVTNDAEFPYMGGMDHDDGMDHGGDMNHGDDGMDMDDGDHGGMDHDDDDEGTDHGDDMDHGDDGMDHDDDFPQLPEIMQIRVAEESRRWWDTSRDPTRMWLPRRVGPDPDDAVTTRKITMEMGMDDHGLMIHTLNGGRWGDGVEFKPELGTTEIWELENGDHHTHPIHLHLVEFEVIGRGEDGTEPPLPNERGGKDVVRVDPGETVRIAVTFENYAGTFPFHCHVLEHEEHDMMRPFEVVEGDDEDDDHSHHPGRGHGRGSDWEDRFEDFRSFVRRYRRRRRRGRGSP